MALNADAAAALAKSKSPVKTVVAKAQSVLRKDIASRTDHGQGASGRPLTPRQARPASPKWAAVNSDEVFPDKGTTAKTGDGPLSPRGDSPQKTPTFRRSKSPHAHVQSRTDHGQSKPKAILPPGEQADSNPAAASSPARPMSGAMKGRVGVLRSSLQQPVRSQGLASAIKEKSSTTGQRIAITGPTTGSTTANSGTGGANTEELEGAVSAESDAADPQEVACLLLGIPTGAEASKDGDAKLPFKYPAPEDETKLNATSLLQGAVESASPGMNDLQPSTGPGPKGERTVAELQSENDRLGQEAQQQRMMIDALENQLRTTQGLQGVENSLGSESMHPDGGGQRREVELLHEAVAGMREQLQKARAQTSNLEQQCQVYQIRMEKLLRNDSASKSGGLTPGVPIPKIPLRTASQPQQRMEYVEVPNSASVMGRHCWAHPQ